MIGANIKKYLEDNGIKQTFIAEKVGITPSQMSYICKNGKDMSCITYYKICKALNVPMDKFIDAESLA